MTHDSPKLPRARRRVPLVPSLLLGLLLALPRAYAHEGHEHHDDDDDAAVAVGAETPRIAFESAHIEAMATTDAGGLVIWIDDYASNRPLAGLAVNVVANGANVQAAEIEPGTYRVPRDLLKAAGDDIALQIAVHGKGWDERFDGKLPLPAPPVAPLTPRLWSVVGAVALLLVLAGVLAFVVRRRRR